MVSQTPPLRFSPDILIRTFSGEDASRIFEKDTTMAVEAYEQSQTSQKIHKLSAIISNYDIEQGSLEDFRKEYLPLVQKIQKPSDAENTRLYKRLDAITKDIQQRLGKKIAARVDQKERLFTPITSSPQRTMSAPPALDSFAEEDEG